MGAPDFKPRSVACKASSLSAVQCFQPLSCHYLAHSEAPCFVQTPRIQRSPSPASPSTYLLISSTPSSSFLLPYNQNLSWCLRHAFLYAENPTLAHSSFSVQMMFCWAQLSYFVLQLGRFFLCTRERANGFPHLPCPDTRSSLVCRIPRALPCP